MAKNSVTPSNILTKEEAEEQIKTTLTGIQNIESTVSAGIANTLEDKIPSITIKQCDSMNGNINIRYIIKDNTKTKIYKFSISISDILDAKKEYQETRNTKAQEEKAQREKKEEEAAAQKHEQIMEERKKAEAEYQRKAAEARKNRKEGTMLAKLKKEREEAKRKAEKIAARRINYIGNIETLLGCYLDKHNKEYLKTTLEILRKKWKEHNPSKDFPLKKIELMQDSDYQEIENPSLEDRLFMFGTFKMIFLRGDEPNKNYVYFCSNEYYLQIENYCKKNKINKLTKDNIQGIIKELGEDQRNI